MWLLEHKQSHPYQSREDRCEVCEHNGRCMCSLQWKRRQSHLKVSALRAEGGRSSIGCPRKWERGEEPMAEGAAFSQPPAQSQQGEMTPPAQGQFGSWTWWEWQPRWRRRWLKELTFVVAVQYCSSAGTKTVERQHWSKVKSRREVVTAAAICGCGSGKRVDWELKVLTVTQLGSLLEAVGIPNTMKRRLSWCTRQQKKCFLSHSSSSPGQGWWNQMVTGNDIEQFCG